MIVPLGIHSSPPPDGLPGVDAMRVPDAAAAGWWGVGVTPERLTRATYEAWDWFQRTIGG